MIAYKHKKIDAMNKEIGENLFIFMSKLQKLAVEKKGA